jgi:uncharacterized membrane protein YhaH (DUF805 family)
MTSDSTSARVSRPAFWIGCIISALPVLLMVVTGVASILQPAQLEKGMQKFGYPVQHGRWIILTEIICALLYAFPRTAVLGAILLTGYLGGATATHVRISDPAFVMPVVLGVVIWLGLFLRDQRVRALIPLRR